MYHLPHQDELGDEADALHPKTLEDRGLGNLDTRFFDPYLAENELVVSLDDSDPQTGEAYAHDTWVELPTVWVRLHRVPRSTLFVPGEQLQGGPVLFDLGGARITITLSDYDGMMLNEDVWTSAVEKPLSVEMVCGATCLEKKDLLVHEVPEVAGPDLYESSARRLTGLPAPAEPTLTERREHELTHLPFRSWFPTCVRAKSKQNHSGLLKTKQLSSQPFNLTTLSLVTTVMTHRSHF